MKTVFITGTSTGIGREAVKMFQSKGWNVIATMRNPQTEKEFLKLKNVKILQCDVTDSESIKKAVEDGIKEFKNIDVLVNNAGYYTIGPFEAATYDQIKRQIDTNLFGLIEVTKEFLPYFRKQRSGTIINVSSIAGNISIPLQTLYHATKWGVEGFSESLQYELRQFNIRVKIIQPGVVNTDFYGRSMTLTKNDELKDYEQYCSKVLKNLMSNGKKGSCAEESAQTIYRAATDNKSKLRYPTGNSKEMVYIRKILPVSWFRAMIQKAMEK